MKKPVFTKAQIATLAWLASPAETPFLVHPRVWSDLLHRGYVTNRNGVLCVTKAGRAALKEYK